MQVQQPRKQRQRRRWSRGQLLTMVVVIVALAVSVVWILSSVGVISSAWATVLSIIVTVSGVVATTWPLISSTSKPTDPPISTRSHDDASGSSAKEPSPSNSKTAYRGIVDRPPPTDPRTIQQREKAVKDIYSMLSQSEVTAVVLIGIGGVGKSTLAGLVYQYAERQRCAGIGLFPAETIWIRIDPAVTMSDLTGTLMEALGKAMPDLSHLSPQNQAVVLLEAMNEVDKARLVILDQFENLLDVRTGQALPDRPGIGEWLDVINSQQCTCRILLTSRLLPQGTRKYPLTYMQAYHVAGLTGAEGAELLQKQGVKATEAELNPAVTRCAGHAFSLTLLASLLHTHKLSLGTLLGDPAYARLWTGNIAQNFLDAIYSQLNDVQRKLLFAFSIYREPVPSEAARVVIGDSSEISKSQVASALHALLVQHLLQATGEGLYQLHAIVATYVQEHIVEDDESIGQEALRAAHARAAQYYLRQAAVNCPPLEQRRQSSDVHDLIETIWQYGQAEQWQKAYDLMRKEWIFPHLNLWGNNATLLELYKLLLPSGKWQPEDAQAALIYNNLGLALRDLGQMRQAQEYFELALRLRRRIGDRKGEGASLNHLGRVYADLGEKERAKECLKQALHIRREVKDKQGETTTLNNLGNVYADLGEKEHAKGYLEQALSIVGKEDATRMKGTTLNNLGKACAELGEIERAIEYLEQSLYIRREIGYRAGEGKTLRNLGSVYKALGQTKQAQQCYQDSLDVFKGLGDREEEGSTLYEMGMLSFEQEHHDVALACFLLASNRLEEVQSLKRHIVERQIAILRTKMGKKRFDALLARIEPNALRIVEQESHEEK